MKEEAGKGMIKKDSYEYALCIPSTRDEKSKPMHTLLLRQEA